MTLQSTLQLYHEQIADWLHNHGYKRFIRKGSENYYDLKEYKNKEFSIEITIQEINSMRWAVDIIIENQDKEGKYSTMSISDFCNTLEDAQQNAVSWIMKLITKPVV